MDLRTEADYRPRAIFRLLVIAAAVTLTSFAPPSRESSLPPGLGAAGRAHPHAAAINVTVPIGERSQLTLPDGTDLLLNTGSELRAEVRHGMRSVALERGEMLARVNKAAAREYAELPVRFHAGDVNIETSDAVLRVRVDPDGTTTVDVLSGASLLRLNHSAQPVSLVAGQKALVQPGTLVVTAYEPSDVKRALAWQEGQVIFQGETLDVAVAEFNRYNRRKVVVVDAALARMRVGGRFEATDVDGFVSALQQSFGVRAMTARSGGAGASVVLLMADRRTST